MFFVGLVAGIVVAGGFAYYKFKSFKDAVNSKYGAFLAEVASVRNRALAGEKLVADDFHKIEDTFAKLFSKF